MITTAQPFNSERDFNSDYERDFDDLVWARRAGHMGHHEFVDSSMPLWAKFIQENAEQYYIPRNEINLIKKAGKLSASVLGNKPVTLVSRGCGTKFLEKEGELIKHLANVIGVVYLDRSDAALEKSMAEGKALLPHAWHKTINCDIYDPNLQYPVDGTEMGVMFGLTLMNIESFPNCTQTTHNAYIKNLKAINNQMRSDAHFITTFDHNQNIQSVEDAYALQGDFAKDMLARNQSVNPDDVEFIIRFNPESHILAHGFKFKKETLAISKSGKKTFQSGDVVWFNNSVKPPKTKIRRWNQECGFSYVRQDIPMDTQSYLGWHHLIKKA